MKAKSFAITALVTLLCFMLVPVLSMAEENTADGSTNTNQEEMIAFKAEHGTETKGSSLQDIVENKLGLKPENIAYWEVTGGKLTLEDKKYILTYIQKMNIKDQRPRSVVIAPGVDVGEAFPDGLDLIAKTSLRPLERVEVSSVKTIKRFWGASDNTVCWAPDVETILSGAFEKAKLSSISLPKLKVIENTGFSNATLKHLVLPGDTVPEVKGSDSFKGMNDDRNVWVPGSMVQAYQKAEDNDEKDGKWWGFEVKAMPEGCTSLQDTVRYYVNLLPAPDQATLECEQDLALAEELVRGMSIADITAELSDKLTQVRSTVEQLYAAPVIEKINALPEKEAIQPQDEQQITEARSAYDALTDDQKTMVDDTLTQRMIDAFCQLQVVKGVPFVYTADRNIGYGNTMDEAMAQTGLTNADASRINKIVIFRGDFSAQNFKDLLKKYQNRKILIADEAVNINDGHLVNETFSANIDTVVLPSIKVINRGAITYTSTSSKTQFDFPNLTTVNQNGITVAGNGVTLNALMPDLETAKSVIPTGEALLRLPRLKSGEKVYENSANQYAYLPALEEAGTSFFSGAKSMTGVWLPALKTLDGDAFKGSGITDLYLENTPPEVTGSNPFEGLNASRTVYVPSSLVNAYKTAEDDNAKDGAWYGWQVETLENAPNVQSLLSAFITQMDGENITTDYSEWIHSLERAVNILNPSQASELKIQIASSLTCVEALEQEDADRVISMIDTLGAPEKLTLEDASKVAAIREAYERLNTASQSRVSNFDKLNAAEVRIETLSLDAVKKDIANLPKEVTEDNKAEVRETYAAYLALNENAKGQIGEAELSQLNTVVDQVITIEKEILSAQTVRERIAALPSPEQLILGDSVKVENARYLFNQLTENAQKRVDNLDVLAAAEKRIEELAGQQTPVKTITLSIEKFTLGQGFIQTPVQIEVKEGDNLAAITANLLGKGNYKNTGSVDNQFYLQSIKDDDTSEANIPDYIKEAVEKGLSEIRGRATANWLGEFDYTEKAGWMYSVNNEIPQVFCGDFTYDKLNDGDVVRWQFSVFGLGADLGYPSSEAPTGYIQVANKDQLSKKLAEVDASTEKLVWMTDADYKAVYDNAYLLMQNMESSQTDVNAAVGALGKTPDTSDIGNVIVTVRDIAARRQETSTDAMYEKEYKELKGLGDYQNPFGVILKEIKVPVKAGMTVTQAVASALESNGYSVEYDGGYITGIGPLATEDKSSTVAQLSNKNAGSLSKWVVSQNDQALSPADNKTHYAEAGDMLVLEYSVDGGADIHCSQASRTRPIYTYSTEVRMKRGTINTVYLPEGTTELKIDINMQVGYPIEDNYSRFNQCWVSVGDQVYKNNEIIPVEPGTVIQFSSFCPPGTGGLLYDITGAASAPSEKEKIFNYTVDYFKTPETVKTMIMALPDVLTFGDSTSVSEATKYYNVLTAEEKEQIGKDTCEKIEEAQKTITALQNALRNEAKPVNDQINQLPAASEITSKNVDECEKSVQKIRADYEALSGDAKTFVSKENLSILEEVEQQISAIRNPYEAPLGTAVDYPNDFMITAQAFNLDIGEETEIYFLDAPRIGGTDQGTNREDLVITVGDPEIVDVILKQIPNPNKESEILDHYYLVPKAAGTTTLTATYPGYIGQMPEIIVHVNNSSEAGTADSLTNINTLIRKYDTQFFWQGEEGADFSFKVNGSNAQVTVQSYLGKEADRTYRPDENGNVTVKLKDGYNPIVVNAELNGRSVTQV